MTTSNIKLSSGGGENECPMGGDNNNGGEAYFPSKDTDDTMGGGSDSEDECHVLSSDSETDLDYSDGDLETSDDELANFRRGVIERTKKGRDVHKGVSDSETRNVEGHSGMVDNENNERRYEAENMLVVRADRRNEDDRENPWGNPSMTEDEHRKMESEFMQDSDSCPSDESSEEVSDAEAIPKRCRLKKKKKYGKWNPNVDIKQITFTVGLEYTNSEEFKSAIRSYAIAHQFNLKFIKNEKKRVCVVCTNSLVCPWRIWASLDSNNKFRIATYTSTHMCTDNLRSRQLTAKWIAIKYYTYLMDNPRGTLEYLKKQISTDFNLDVSLGTCGKARKKALAVGSSSMIEHYAKIWDYRNELRRTNMNSTVETYCIIPNPEYGPIFQRFYVCFDALKRGFLKGCRKILGLDGCFLKGCMKGELLCAVGRDANNQMFPVAWGVVQVESKNSWGWFLYHLIKDLEMQDGSGWTIISDQQKGLVIKVAEMLPECEHRACARHVFANWYKNFKGGDYKMHFWNIARSTNLVMYKSACDELKKFDEKAFDDLMGRKPEKWCKAFFGTDSLTDSCENNMSEGFNGALVEARRKPLIYMLEDLRMKMMTRLHHRREWMRGHWDDICPRIRKKIEENTTFSRHWQATYNGNYKFQVDSRKEGYIVDIGRRTCTCREWDMTGIPCCHAIASLIKIGRKVDDMVADCYRKKAFLDTYAYSIEPIRGENNWEKSRDKPMKPPQNKAMPGRPKTKRIIPADEEPKATGKTKKISKNGKQMVCSVCKKSGHNKRGCKSEAAVKGRLENANMATSMTSVPSTSKAKPKKGEAKAKTPAQREPVERAYTKTRNDGRKKPDATIGEKRKRGRPRKNAEPQPPKFNFCGVYVSPAGDTFFKAPGSSRAINLDTYVPPATQAPNERPRTMMQHQQ